uniref:Odorant receptor 29 n=1 Tax=Holotrichia parallela TaxID=93412 RepID=A0A2P9JY67_HOLPA|nr:odorant receptor 29 [Holotrichia parallela]
MKNLEALISEIHVLLMYIFFISNQKLIALILSTKASFRSTTNSPLMKKLTEIKVCVNKFLFALAVSGYSTVIMLFLALLADRDKFLILESWSPDNYILGGLYSLMQLFMLSMSAQLTLGIDCLLVAFCCHLIIQVRLLKYDFRRLYVPLDADTIAERRVRKELIKCVKYHKFIMRFFENLRKLCSSLFLCQYTIALVSFCTELYAFSNTKEEFDVTELFKSVFYTSTILLEFGMYCFCSQYVVDEMRSLSDAIYASKWYECKTNVQKDLLFIIMRTHSQTGFTAGGLIAIDVQAFASVIKKAFSFYALMKSLF